MKITSTFRLSSGWLLSLILGVAAISVAQEGGQAPPAAGPSGATQADSSGTATEVDASGVAADVRIGHSYLTSITDFGKPIGGGWNLSFSGQVLGTYDSNPLMQTSATASDLTTHLAGAFSVTRRTGRTRFEANYLPEYSQYRRFDQLNALSHTYSQSLTHLFSKRTSLGWTLQASRRPSSNSGSSFAAGNFGSLLLATGAISSANLQSDETNVRTGWSVTHQLNRRSSIAASVNGSAVVYQYHDRGLDSLLSGPGRRDYSGSAELDYDYQILPKQSIGVSIKDTYRVGLRDDRRIQYQAANLRYGYTFGRNFVWQVGVGPGYQENGGYQGKQGSGKAVVDFNTSLQKELGRTRVNFTVSRSQSASVLTSDLVSWNSQLGVQRTLGRYWTAGSTVNYTYAPNYYRTGSGSAELFSGSAQGGYLISRNFRLVADYGFFRQRGYNGFAAYARKHQVALGLVFDVNGSAVRH